MTYSTSLSGDLRNAMKNTVHVWSALFSMKLSCCSLRTFAMNAPCDFADIGKRLVDVMIRPLNTRPGSSAAAGRTMTVSTSARVRATLRAVIALDGTRSRFEQGANRVEAGSVRRVGTVDTHRDLDSATRKRSIDLGYVGLVAKRIEVALDRGGVATPDRSREPCGRAALSDVSQRTLGERYERARRGIGCHACARKHLRGGVDRRDDVVRRERRGRVICGHLRAIELEHDPADRVDQLGGHRAAVGVAFDAEDRAFEGAHGQLRIGDRGQWMQRADAADPRGELAEQLF